MFDVTTGKHLAPARVYYKPPLHASTMGSIGAVYGTSNENFLLHKTLKGSSGLTKGKDNVNPNVPVASIATPTTQVKQRRFRVESSDR